MTVDLLTKSKAATFRRLTDVSFDDKPSGTYLPTSKVSAPFAFPPRSCHIILGGGFLEAGVKKDDTAFSGFQISEEIL